MAPSCASAGSDWLLGRISFQKPWNGLPRAGGESPSLEGMKSRVDPALRDLVELGTVSARLTVGLDDLQGPFQPR